jgi:hypothetical protein
MDRSREYDSPNKRLYGPGVAANHSSESASVDSDLDHSQSDEALQNVPPPQDPNLSGNTPTEDCYTWLAGSMDGWCENDDYREYFEKSRGCDGMLACDPADGDYDDNGGVPTGVGHSRGTHGPSRSGTVAGADQYSLGTVIVRRI